MIERRSGWDRFLPFALLAVYLMFYYHLGPRIAAKGGFGFDGRLYGELARDFFSLLESAAVKDYHVNRLLPSFVVFSCTRALGLPLETASEVYTAFFVYDSLLLSLGLILWLKVSGLIGLDRWIYWLGVCALAVNSQSLKMMPYYPTLTDSSGWLLGLLAVHAYLRDRKLVLLACLALGFFTWPIGCIFILLLLAFPKDDAATVRAGAGERAALTSAGLAAALGAYVYVVEYDGRSLGDPLVLLALASRWPTSRTSSGRARVCGRRSLSRAWTSSGWRPACSSWSCSWRRNRPSWRPMASSATISRCCGISEAVFAGRSRSPGFS